MTAIDAQNPDPRIIGASWLISGDSSDGNLSTADFSVHSDTAILVRNGSIAAVDTFAALCQEFPQIHAQFLEGHVLLPGLINCHGHAAMSLLRGYADDLPLQNWLQEQIWPAEAQWLSADFVHCGGELAIAEMLLSGTTTFSDMYFYPETIAQLAESIGIRAQITFPVMEMPNVWAEDAQQAIDKGLALHDQYRYSDYVNIGFGPHAPYTVSDKSFERITMLAEEVDAPIQLHLHETTVEIEQSINAFGKTPLQRLHQLGVLSPRTQLVHVTQLNDQDRLTLAQTNASVVHCPNSNLKLASGYCDIAALQQAGICVALGTDSAASNNTLDMFDTLRNAALLAKHHSGNAQQIPAHNALYMATLGGAKTLGIDHLTGSLSLGKSADIVSVDLNNPAMQPVYNPLSQLVYTQAGSAVRNVWIAGKQKVADGKLMGLNLNNTLRSARQWQHRIAGNHPATHTDTLSHNQASSIELS